VSGKCDQIDQIFWEATRRTDDGDRKAYLDTACRDNKELRLRVEKLLAAQAKAEHFLEQPFGPELPPTLDTSPIAEQPGMTIGRYKLVHEIGHGGMGVVYMAVQKEPVKRKVALKIIKPGMDTKEVVARFNAERQALAMMDHQNIAKVLDGGSTESGRPYFVMELVEGRPIHEYCDECRYTTRQRLELFIRVCHAVQHAHLKGIIHRDIKPSNILVTNYDHIVVPKVIDFGIAKALHQRLSDDSVYTKVSQIIGTPMYMSPEQAQHTGMDVDTRTDVYSLGALLYVLLTGAPPFEKRRLKNSSLEEIKRIIREEDPLRPSTRLSTLGNRLDTVIEKRHTDRRTLANELSSELDWIVMKAMAKDRARRYETAKEFAEDLQRYLNDKPVEACPPSTVYRLKKTLRRHKAFLTTLSMVFLSLLVGAGLSLWQASRAKKAEHLSHLRLIEAQTQQRTAFRAAEEARARAAYSRELVYAADTRLAFQAWQDGDIRHFTDLLDRHLPAEGHQDLRGFEWFFLRQLAQAACLIVAEGTGGSSCARYSPEGDYLVTAGYDGTLCVRDAQSFRTITVFRSHEGTVWGIDFAPDGATMATIGDDGKIRLWSTNSWTKVHEFQAHEDSGSNVLFALNGTMLVSSGNESSIRLWDPASGASLGALHGHAEPVTSIDVSPDGRSCVSGEKAGAAANSVILWDLQTRERIITLDNPDAMLTRSCRFSPDGTQLAIATEDCDIRLVDIPTQAVVAVLSGHDDDIQDMAFHPTAPLLVSSDRGGVIRTWTTQSPQTTSSITDAMRESNWPACFRAHQARIWTIEFSPDGGRVVSASKDGTVRAWKGHGPFRQELEEAGTGRDAAVSRQTEEIIVTQPTGWVAWNWQLREAHAFRDLSGEEVMSVAVAPAGKSIATGHRSGFLRFWDFETRELLAEVKAHNESPDHLSFSPNGQLLSTASWDGKGKLWDATSLKQLAVFDMSPHCLSTAISPNGNLLAFSSEDCAMLFDVKSGVRLHLLEGHQNTVDCIDFSPDSRLLATGSHDRTIRIWDTQTGEVLHEIAAHRDKVDAIAFSADGRTIASGDKGGTVAFSHVPTGQFLFSFQLADTRILKMLFVPHGETLVITKAMRSTTLLHVSRGDIGGH
jgi:WD40 repeat protein/serine/threonine protein kinase